MKTNNSEEPYKDKYTLLENLRKSFIDPSLSPKMLRENGCALAEEYTAILHKLVNITRLRDTTQRKLLNADLTIREQQKELKGKNARLEQDISEQIKLKKQLQRQTEKLTATNKKLTRTIEELTQRNLEMLTLQQLGEFLQACESEKETYQVLIGTCRRLFPSDSGYLSLLDDSLKLLRIVASWGDVEHEHLEFEQQQCWAVRRGKTHAVRHPKIDPVCPHLNLPSDKGCFCVPMTAQGEVLGMMHLLIGSEILGQQSEHEFTQVFESKQRLFVSIADRYSMRLVDLRLRETLKMQSIRDQLTGLYNRRHMEASFQREISRAQRHNSLLGVIMIDVDHFNVFNDTYGHDLGDMVLRELGNFLLHHTREEDIACRYGGEEFFIIMPEASLENTYKRAEQLKKGVEELAVKRDNEYHTVTISLGIATFPEHGATADEIVRAADSALYQAKSRGRNQVVISTVIPGMF
ncbi:MAG: diguanylate cyclase [Candidatus Electrothrix sp. AR4]|nr:diguanylate cyclase [Candidatus Electrothrix sp. AR4]